MSDPGVGRAASNRHRPDDLSGRERADDVAESAAHGRGALIALGVAAVGTVGFVIGLRTALRHLPPERPAAAGAAAAVDTARPHRFNTPAHTEGDGYPRLR